LKGGAASPWTSLLGGFDVELLGPKQVSSTAGSPDAAGALAAAGGMPASAPATPLVVCVNDPDRATDSASALRAIRAAAPTRRMTIVVATGSHRWNDAVKAAHEAPLRAAAGECDVVWHDGTQVTTLSPVWGTRLAAAVVAAKDLVGVGSVEPHWFAGLTGAHKTLTVGVMHRDDIAASHVHAMEDGARPFRLAGNPVHEGFVRVLDALQSGRRVVALQEIAGRWFGGAPLDCLAQAAPLAEARWLHRAKAPYDLLVAVVDPPLSRNLYQAEKGLKNSESAVRDGGALLIDAACEDGIGPDRFFALLRAAPDVAAARAHVTREYRLGDHKAVRLRSLQARGVRIGLVSETFPAALGAEVGITVFPTREAAARSLGGGGRAAVVADAGNMVVVA
jgi:nickel-dependent lactate racemase